MSYQIADEPSPEAGWEKLVFPPSAPLLGMMWCGAWLAWPWFILNARAMGSPTVFREARIVLGAGILGSLALAFGVYTLVDAGVIESKLALQLALLSVVSLKLGVAYAVTKIQTRTYHIYTYYGGATQKAFYVLVAGSYLRVLVLGLSAHPVWQVVLS